MHKCKEKKYSQSLKDCSKQMKAKTSEFLNIRERLLTVFDQEKSHDQDASHH